MQLVAELGERAFELEGGACAVAVTRDGKRVISINRGICIWDIDTGARLGEIATTLERQSALALSPDGKRILVAGKAAVQVFSLGAKPKVIAKPDVKQPRSVYAVAFAPDGGFVFADRDTPRRFDAKGKELVALAAHPYGVSAIAVSSDGTRVVSCGADLTQLHAIDGKKPKVIGTWEESATSCGFSPDGVWTSGENGTVMRDVATGKTTWQSERIRGVGSVHDGCYACLANGKVAIHAPPRKTPLVTIAFAARTCAFSPDGARIVVASDELGIAVFEVSSGQRLLPSATGTPGAIDALAVAAKLPHAVYSGGWDGSITLWDVEVGAPVERIGAVRDPISRIACASDGNIVIAAAKKPTAFDVRAGSNATFAARGACWGVVMSPNGKRIATIANDPRTLEVFDLATRKCIATVKLQQAARSADVVFVNDEIVAAFTWSGAVTAVTARGGHAAFEIETKRTTALCVVGGTIVVGHMSGRIEAYDASTRERTAQMRDKRGEVRRLCAVDDDLVAALAEGERKTTTVEVWSLAKQRSVGRAAIAGEATALAVSADGTRIFVGTKAGRLLVFRR